MNNELMPGQSAELDSQRQIESANLVPVRVRDERDPLLKSFDLNGFVDDLEAMRQIFIDKKSLYKIDNRIRERFQKYAGVGFSESDHFLEALKQAKAIEVFATSGKKIFQAGQTIIDVNIITQEVGGYRFTFEYDQNGNYYNANWDEVNFEKTNPELDALPEDSPI
ncbi:MAG: hypothetical protein WCX71_04840 [Candidatus Buchananbacteria bacterium]